VAREHTFTDAAGLRHVEEITKIPFVTHRSERDSVLGVSVDITQRKKAEEALRESERRFRTVVEQAGDGFELLDMDGRFRDLNSATCRLLLYSREELLGMRVTDVDPGMSPERFATAAGEMPLGIATTIETTRRRRDGTPVPVEVTASKVRLGGTAHIIGLVRDISERKRTEAKIAGQLEELRRWYDVMLGRETRVVELKKEVNDVLAELGMAPRYASAVESLSDQDAARNPGDGHVV
jgi:PAS domain S-box-containing protein